MSEKITRERTIKIIEYSTHRQISKEYEIYEDGNRLFGWNNSQMPIGFITKVLFKPLPTTYDKIQKGD